jgi:hypothetical protein
VNEPGYQMSDLARTPSWLGASALVMAAISLVTFGMVMSISGPFPKAVAYSPNLLFAIYSVSPTISAVSGVVSILIATIALRRASLALEVAAIGIAIGILLFFFVTILAANVMSTVAPAPPEGKGLAASSIPLIALSPPVVGMAAVLIGVVAVLSRLRGVSGLRPAIAALITGGVVTAYWLLNLVMLSAGGD